MISGSNFESGPSPSIPDGEVVFVRMPATAGQSEGVIENGWTVVNRRVGDDEVSYVVLKDIGNDRLMRQLVEATALEALQRYARNTFPASVESSDEADWVHDTIPRGIPPIRSETPTLDAVIRLKDSSVAEKLQREAALTHQQILGEEKDFLTAIEDLAGYFVETTRSLYFSPERHLIGEIETIVDYLRSAHSLSWDSGEENWIARNEKELEIMGLLLTISR